jgi:AcrR family transcriptional regulator
MRVSVKTPPKKAGIVATGRTLFLRFGIRKVRVEEICADARVSKRTFYKYFRDKDDLAIAVLGELFEEARARLEPVIAADGAIEEKVKHVIAIKAQMASETSAAFYREVVDGGTAPGRFVVQEQRKWDERVRRFYADAQARGQIRSDIDIDVLMAFIARIRDLLKDPELVRLVPDLSLLVETLMKLFFYGIVPRPETGTGKATRKKGRNKP